MKKINLIISCLLLVAWCCLNSCKKSAAGTNSERSVLTYEYQGKVYDGNDGNWGLILSGIDVVGIQINRTDLFGGEVIYKAPGCAYTDPHTKMIVNSEGCMLMYDDSTAIDSSVVYLYSSGNFNSTSSNCSTKYSKDIFTGETVIEVVCDIKANFSVTLINNKGDIINIQNGSVAGTFQIQ